MTLDGVDLEHIDSSCSGRIVNEKTARVVREAPAGVGKAPAFRPGVEREISVGTSAFPDSQGLCMDDFGLNSKLKEEW